MKMSFVELMQTKILVLNHEFNISNVVHDSIVQKVIPFSVKMSRKNQSFEHWKEERGATKPMDDNNCGKYAEFAAMYCLYKNYGFPMQMPDLVVREGNRKKWDYDLPFSIRFPGYPNVHVKSCTRKTRRFLRGKDKYSWMFQYSNTSKKGGKDEVFKNKQDTSPVVFMYVPSLESIMPVLVAIAPCNLLHSYNLFRDPLKSDLIGIKKCIYYQDLVKYSNSQVISV